jgi:uncharacterized protein (DUF2236 family)
VAPDLGYFGPLSVTWRVHRVHRVPVSMVGGLRALLLQALHPGAMELLAQRSDLRADPWRRFQTTLEYVGTVCFEPRSAVDAAAARVRDVHEQLGIDDPDQLAWVHLCLVDSFLAAARGAGIPVSAAEADGYVAEQQVAASLVGVPADLVPSSLAELEAAIEAMRPTLRSTPAARDAASLVLVPPMQLPVRYAAAGRMAWSTACALAVGLLPRWAMRMYRVPVSPGRGAATTVGLHAVRRAVRTLPTRYREGPLARRARERAAAARGVVVRPAAQPSAG